jgi:hypothetical protein
MARKASGNREGREDPTDEVVDDQVDDSADIEDSDADAEDLDDEAGDTEYEDEYEEDEELSSGDDTAVEPSSSRAAGQRSLSERLSTAFLKPKAPEDDSQMTDAEKAKAIRRLDSLERKLGFVGAALVAVIAGVAFIPYIRNPNKLYIVARSGKTCPTGFKDHLVNGAHQCAGVYTRGHYVVEMLIVLLFAAFILVATIVGKRSLLAFALLFSGLAVSTTTGSLFGLIFLIGGGWLLVRGYRLQKYGTASGKEVAQIARERRAERTASGGKASSARATSGGGRSKPTRSSKSAKGAPQQTTPTGRAKPQASKRYTPKTPPRKRPPPAE